MKFLGKQGMTTLISLIKDNTPAPTYSPKSLKIGQDQCASIKNGTVAIDILPTIGGCILNISGLIEAEDFTTISITDDVVNSINFKVGSSNSIMNVMSESDVFVCCKSASITLTSTGFNIGLANIIGNTMPDGSYTDIHLIGTVTLFDK